MRSLSSALRRLRPAGPGALPPARAALMAALLGTLLSACGPADADGDGLDTTIDCDDTEASVGGPSLWYLDVDGDGYGVEEETAEACTAPSGYVELAGDCNDDSASVSPVAQEVCNGIDDNCDEAVDEEAPGQVWYADADGDGYGNPNEAQESCTGGGGLVADSTDCDDSDADTYPGADETCDDRDNDCDGQIDEGAPDGGSFYVDGDGDGYGVGGGVIACDLPEGYAEADGDCDDSDPNAYPGADELCDGRDNDCDSTVDEEAIDAPTWYADADADGYGDLAAAEQACVQPDGTVANSEDCDDGDAAIHPETWWYTDDDGDGWGVNDGAGLQQCVQPGGTAPASGDCDDSEPTVHPGQPEECDGLDNDCDGEADEGAADAQPWYADSDGDGYGYAEVVVWSCDAPGPDYSLDDTDCDDTRDDVHPDHPEVCDDVDNDCDELIDIEDPALVDIPTWFPDEDGDGYGEFDGNITSCDAPTGFVLDGTDCDDEDREVHVGAIELCDGIDNDCDALVDAADAVDSIAYYEDVDGDTWGDDATLSMQCAPLPGQVEIGGDCDDSDAAVHPLAEEACDATMDLNCDGSFGFADADGDGFVACEDCDDSEPLSYPGAPEVCDFVDNDCNGIEDDDGAGGFPWRWYLDEDGDGYGLSYEYVTWCDLGNPPGYVETPGDCNDELDTVYPLAPEECNLIDDDCDGVIPPEEVDLDGDGYTPTSCGGEDCADDDFATNPDGMEVCGDGIDNDCVDGDAPCVYIFSGILTDVDQADLTGWEECFVDLYRDTSSLTTIWNDCDLPNILVGCRLTGSTTLITAAQAPREDVQTNTGTGNTTHVANDVGWYYNNSYSMGYIEPGDSLSRNSCDTATGSFPQHRLCFHTSSNRLSGGYRCGVTTGLNSSSTYERVFMHADF